MARLFQTEGQATQAAIAAGANPQSLAIARQYLEEGDYTDLLERFIDSVEGQQYPMANRDMGYPISLETIGQIARRAGLSDEGARIAMAIAQTEGGLSGAIGDNGMSYGPFQFHVRGELGNLAQQLGIDVQKAAQWVQSNPVKAAEWALRGYLGQAIRQGEAQGLQGANLATYAQTYGQRSQNPWKAGGNYSALFGRGRAGLMSPQRRYLSDEDDTFADIWGEVEGEAPAAAATGGTSPWWTGFVPDTWQALAQQYLTGAQAGANRYVTEPGPRPGTYFVTDQQTGYRYLFQEGDPTLGIKDKLLQTIKPSAAPKAPTALEEEYERLRNQRLGLEIGSFGQGQALDEAQFQRQLAMDRYNQAIDQRDFGAAQYWKQRSDYWQGKQYELQQAQLGLQQSQFMTDIATKPTAWAALATRGQPTGGPVNALDWLRQGMAGQPSFAASVPQADTDLPWGQYQQHLRDIGGAPDTPEMRQAWATQYRQERGLAPPTAQGQGFSLPSLGQMPWYQSIAQGTKMPGWRLTPEAVEAGLSNKNILQSLARMSPTEQQMLAGTAGAYGVSPEDWFQSIQRIIPTGTAPVGRYRWRG